MRLIDADKLYPDCMTSSGTLAISQSQIAHAPLIESRLKGKWVIDVESKNFINCSNCGLILSKERAYYNYCFICGAKMESE